MPFLDEAEWAQVSPLVMPSLYALRELMKSRGLSLQAAISLNETPAQQKFTELTGHVAAPSELVHHRLADYGSACEVCGELIRTPAGTCVMHAG
jgi:hypothetical protein